MKSKPLYGKKKSNFWYKLYDDDGEIKGNQIFEKKTNFTKVGSCHMWTCDAFI